MSASNWSRATRATFVGCVLLNVVVGGCAAGSLGGAPSSPSASPSAPASPAPSSSAPASPAPSSPTVVTTANGTGAFELPADWTLERNEGPVVNFDGRYQWSNEITATSPDGAVELLYLDGSGDDAYGVDESGVVAQFETMQGFVAAAYWSRVGDVYNVNVAVIGDTQNLANSFRFDDINRIYAFTMQGPGDKEFASEAEAEAFLGSPEVDQALAVLKTVEAFPVDQYAWPDGFTPPADPEDE